MATSASSVTAAQSAGVATLSVSSSVTQMIQSPVIAVPAVNLPNNFSSLPTVPLAMQMQGVNSVPIAMCAVNSQQPAVPASANIMQTVAATQANAGGGNIIVLNVGAGNNLAAAISQLVAGGLIQQQQQQVVQAATTTATRAVEAPTNTMVTPQNSSFANQVLTGTSQNLIQNQISSVAAASTPNAVYSSVHPGHQPTPPLQTGMHLANQIRVPVQQQQPQQQAFMLVPIQQMPGVQGGQVGALPGYMNMSPQQPQQQQPVFLNLQNQMMGAHAIQSPNPPTSMVQRLLQPPTPQPPPGNTQPAFPKNDELKAYLTQTMGNHPLMGQLAPHSVPNAPMSTTHAHLQRAAAASSSGAISRLLSTTTHLPQSIQNASQPPGVEAVQPVRVSTPESSRHQFQTTVSSPGLAILAQISSLSASRNQTLINATEPSPTVMTMTTSLSTPAANTIPTAVSQAVQQRMVTGEVNNNLEQVANENAKAQDSPLSAALLAPACSTPSSSMMVSSTTKLGDDSIPEIVEGSSIEQASEITITEIHDVSELHKITEDSTLSYQSNLTITTSPSDKKGVKEKRKKGPAPKLNGTELCLICGDKASGFHYNVLSCEGCKGFFRRSVIKNAHYQCKMNGDCQMDLFMRRKCQKCRFGKCKLVGMKEESVLSEEQVKAKKMKKESDFPFSPMRALSEDTAIPTLTPQQRNLVELLKANEKRFEWPTTEDMQKVTAWVEEDDSVHSRALRFAHFTELCILIVQLVVEFTKQLPGFLTVLREDQIVLLKACAIEVMLLRAAKQYNKHDGTINFLNGKLYDKSSFYRAGMQVEFVDPIFQFCSSMARLDLDETEYAILVAINTFSTDRPQIKDTEKVECMQDPYVELLRVYSRIRHPNDPLMFARILMKIVELRTLNNYHSEQIFALKVQDRKLPPLLAEIWDM